MNQKTIFSKFVISKPPLLFSNFTSSASTKQSSEISFDLNSCIAFLQSCAHNKNLTGGKQIHSFMLRNGLLDSPLSVTSLINMYSKCGQMNQAVLVFNYPNNDDRNVFAYNAIISGFVANGLSPHGFEIYRQMRLVGIVPDKFTFPCLIKSCCDLTQVLEVKKIQGLVFKLGLEVDVFVGSAFVNSYLKFGLMGEAQQLFVEMPVKDVALWNSMVNGYAQIGKFDEALSAFRWMAEEGVMMSRFTITGILSVFATNENFDNGRAVHGFVVKMGYDSGVSVLNALIHLYGKCKSTRDASEIFEMMEERDIFSWNSILSVYEHCGDHDGTLMMFDRMLLSGIQPDLVTVTTILPACSNLAALMHGRRIHEYMIINGFAKDGNCEDFDDVLMNNAFMDMYAKCGSLRDARMIFNKMSNKDTASWNIMIMGYGMHGHGNEALHMFACMCEEKIKPDAVTFVGLLSACNHAGFVNEGHEYFKQMKSKYSVEPDIEHYTCVIDMLGRTGQLDEAYELAKTMLPKPNPVVWRALLAACRLHGYADLAEIAAERVFELEPGHCANYVLMSNVYVSMGRYEEVLDVRDTMRRQNVKKTPGCSWIELKNGVHSFITGDRSHPETKSIFAGLNSLTARLGDDGFVPNVLSLDVS